MRVLDWLRSRFFRWRRPSVALSVSRQPSLSFESAEVPSEVPLPETIQLPISDLPSWSSEELQDPRERVLADLAQVPLDGVWDEALTAQLIRDIELGNLQLPRIPALATELLTMSDEDMGNAKAIANIIARDPEVTGSVMKLANSVIYARGRARSVASAVTRLGTVLVREVALGSTLRGSVYHIPGYDSEARILRDRAFRAGLTCSGTGMSLGYAADGGACFLSGLFHDVGHVIVLRALSSLRSHSRGQSEGYQPSSELMHALHVPLGVLYAVDRELPMSVRGAIAGHHSPPAAAAYSPYAWLVWSVDAVDSIRGPDMARRLEALKMSWPVDAPAMSLIADHVRQVRTMCGAMNST